MVAVGRVKADEGMWLPILLKEQKFAEMRKKGLKLSAEEIYSVNQACLKDAIIGLVSEGPDNLRSFCSASFVSDEGLLITNFHCIMSYIERFSTPENDFLKKIIIKKCFLLKKCLYASVGRVTEKNTIKRIVYKVMYRIPNKWIFKSFDKMAKKYSDNRYTQLCTYAFVKDNPKKLMKRNWHRDRVEIEFEGRKFFAPKAYKEWLTYTYGKDYMTPPPIDKQIGDNAISYFCIYKEL